MARRPPHDVSRTTGGPLTIGWEPLVYTNSTSNKWLSGEVISFGHARTRYFVILIGLIDFRFRGL